MRLILFDRNVVVAEIKDRTHRRIELQMRKRKWTSLDLFARLFEVIFLQMRIAQCVHEIADTEIAHLRDHMREQRVAGDVERHA